MVSQLYAFRTDEENIKDVLESLESLQKMNQAQIRLLEENWDKLEEEMGVNELLAMYGDLNDKSNLLLILSVVSHLIAHSKNYVDTDRILIEIEDGDCIVANKETAWMKNRG